MTTAILAPAPLHDGLPRCPDWCRTCRTTGAFTEAGIAFGAARLHAAVLLDGGIKVTAERYDEVGQEPTPDEFTLHIGDVWIPLTAAHRRDLRAVLDRIDAGGVRS